MLKGRRTRKVIAIFLCLMMLSNIVAPTAAYALTSGPTSPEANSFEPVDTNTMVNFKSGDLSYNIPIIEVPGPEGGYPLSLSYSAGIQPGLDASWVGLGWSLNPGAINRSVNGYADDLKGVEDIARTYHGGGERRSYGVNVGIGAGNMNVGFGLTIATDTYMGVDVGANIGVRMGISDHGQPGYSGRGSIGLSLSKQPFSTDLSLGLDLSGSPMLSPLHLGTLTKGLRLSSSVSFETNFRDISAEASVGLTKSVGRSVGKNKNTLGLSYSTSGNTSFSVNGASSYVSNSTAGKWTTSSWGFQIPVWEYVTIGYNYMRYWSDETNNVGVYGTLYNRLENIPNYDPASWFTGFNANTAYDTYELLDPDMGSIVDYPDTREVLGGSFPANDAYVVSAQGLGGIIRPYSFQEQLFNQSYIVNEGTQTRVAYQSYKNGYTNPIKKQFRFSGDFSNTYRQQAPDVNYSTTEPAPYTGAYQAVFNFDNSPVYGTDGYNVSENRLSGSKHIDYFTNAEIVNGIAKTKGFVDYDPTSEFNNFNGRASTGDQADQIGAFSITNSNGLTYHFALAAKSFFEFSYTEKINATTAQYSQISKPYYYAYCWHLTTITGPDFVDRNNNGYADEADWGMWVNFEYGLWDNYYKWRNPGEGFHKDLDNEFQDFSKGLKDVYYLNAIRTRTHTALFVKDIRQDGRGSADAPYFEKDYGGFNSTSKYVMKLDKIYLFANADVQNIRTISDPFGNLGYGDNVLDYDDLTSSDIAKAIRAIGFSYDYSLCPTTPNSFAANKGKLALKSLAFNGKGNVCLIPPMQFQYELPSSEIISDNILIGTTDASSKKGSFTSNVAFEEGDILALTSGSTQYFGAINKKNSSTSYQIVYTSSTYPSANTTVQASTTKNPCYNTDATDIWGMYKSDYRTGISGNDNMAKMVTAVSAKGVDAWSLRKIVTSTGAEISISFESDTYSKSVYDDFSSYTIRDVTYSNNGSGTTDIDFYVKDLDYITDDLIKVGDKVDLLLMKRRVCQNGIYSSEITETPLNSESSGQVFVTNIATDGKITARTTYLWTTLTSCDINGCTPSGWCFVIGGNLKTYIDNKIKFGGGLRIKSIRLTNPLDNTSEKSIFEYSNITNPLISSGVTSFEPRVMPYYNFSPYTAWPDYIKDYRRILLSKINRFLLLTREVPPPGVMYEFVTVKSQFSNQNDSRDIPGKVVYQYRVFKKNMVQIIENLPRVNNNTNHNHVRNMSIKNFTSSIGALRKVIIYDNLSNKLSETTNSFLDDGYLDNDADGAFYASYYDSQIGQRFSYQGVIKERYALKKYLYAPGPPYGVIDYFGTITSMREEYPMVNTGSTSIDYLTNSKTESKVLGFDFYNGEVNKTLDIDAYGNTFSTEIEFAYNKYPSLGLKGMNLQNKNMLTQEASSHTFKVDANNNKLGLTSANIQTWSNLIPVVDNLGAIIVQNQPGANTVGNVWRKDAVYSWMPEGSTIDGITSIGNFSNFNWADPSSSNIAWKKIGTTTKYDIFSNSLEGSDINGKYSAVRMGYKQSRVLMVADNARYSDLAYQGFEDDPLNGVSNPGFTMVGAITSDPISVHTGKTSIALLDNTDYLNYTIPISQLQQGRDYSASLWIRTSTDYPPSGSALYCELNNGTTINGSVTAKAGQWYLLTVKIPASAIAIATMLTVGSLHNVPPKMGTYYLDDFRFHPFDATVATYVYDNKSGEVTCILDNNNIFTKFIYDASGRLVKTYSEDVPNGIRPLKSYSYNYATNCENRKWYNEEITARFIKNNCPSGYTGTEVIYTVPDAKYSSTISQSDADALAQVDLNSNGQNYANLNGYCTLIPIVYYNVQTSGVFYKNDCPPGQVGSAVTYTVPAGTYSSTISQADADAQAQADVNANGQNYANNNGTCTTPPTSCTFNVASGWSTVHPSLSSLSGVVTFNLDLLPISITSISLNTPILVGNIGIFDLSCKPSVIRTVSGLVDNPLGLDNGRRWSLSFWPSGEVYLTLTTSPVNPFVLGPGDPSLIFSGTYNL